jgi:beta-phosphoglucomutase-like phosphatase (HAD superfamily)
MIEALLSDIDGSLVESNWLHAGAWQNFRHIRQSVHLLWRFNLRRNPHDVGQIPN